MVNQCCSIMHGTCYWRCPYVQPNLPLTYPFHDPNTPFSCIYYMVDHHCSSMHGIGMYAVQIYNVFIYSGLLSPTQPPLTCLFTYPPAHPTKPFSFLYRMVDHHPLSSVHRVVNVHMTCPIVCWLSNVSTSTYSTAN
jgi:hypothetical protein